MVSIGYLPPLLDALHSPSKRKRMGSITALQTRATESIPWAIVDYIEFRGDEKE